MDYKDEIVKILDEMNDETITKFIYRLLCSFRKKWSSAGKGGVRQ